MRIYGVRAALLCIGCQRRSTRKTCPTMAKRFIDTDLFRKPFMRGLEAPYKALWLYLLCECDHAGIWIVELDVAQMRMGMKLDAEKALLKMNGAAIEVDGGNKWFLPDFIAFQYGVLNPANRVHASVIERLSAVGIDYLNLPEKKGLASPLQGAKDKDKDKEKDKEKEKEKDKDNARETDERFEALWKTYEGKGAKGKAREYWSKLSEEDRAAIIAKAPAYVESTSGEFVTYRKNLEGWINPLERRWEAPITPRRYDTPKPKVWTKQEAIDEVRRLRDFHGKDFQTHLIPKDVLAAYRQQS